MTVKTCQRRGCGRVIKSKNQNETICRYCRTRGFRTPEGRRSRIKLTQEDIYLLSLSEEKDE